MEERHTATPWRATGTTGPKMHSYSQPHGVATAHGNHATLICGCFGDTDGGEEAAKANSEFIVRACNSFDDLVKIAKMLSKFDEEEGLSPAALGLLKDLAFAALTKAGAQS